MRLASITLAALCAAALGGCANTLQDQPIPHNILEGLIVAPFPVYWAGASFHGLAVTDAEHDPGGAYWVQYGDCVEGGQATCVAPLRVVTSPDNSFLPGGSARSKSTQVRGVRALLAQRGRTIVLATGPVVISVFARDAALARAAARTIAPINTPGAPRAPLPAALGDSGYGETPLASQVPSQVRVLR
ncbi:MAG: hypothetical protein QOI03_2216 [Solirubrobacteraceae bacterium]|nr:hypothetical protein [Solirubrobacteraceae bacterium]